MNPIFSLLGLEVCRRYIERVANCRSEGKDARGEYDERVPRVTDVMGAIDAEQKVLLGKLAQRFVHPTSDYPPTVEPVDVFSSLLRGVVQCGSVVRLCILVLDCCGSQPFTCSVECDVGGRVDCGGMSERDGNHKAVCPRGGKGVGGRLTAGRSRVDISGTTLPQGQRGTRVCPNSPSAPTPSFELWDAELLGALRRVGDVVSEAHNEMLVALNALGDGRVPQLAVNEHTSECPSLWMEIVCLFEDAFETVLRNVVHFILWWIYQHILGRQGLAVCPLFTVKALWSYSSSCVITSPSPAELHERLMQRIKKDLIWVLVPEFRLSQMTKRPVPSVERTKRPMLRDTFMEDANIKRLWETIHYTASQRCDEVNKEMCALTDTYIFYFSNKEEYYTRLGPQRLREMVVAVRNYGDDLVQPVASGAFAVQTETLRQIVLDKLEPILKSVQGSLWPGGLCAEGNMTPTRWKTLVDVQINTSPTAALSKRLNSFRAGRNVKNKYDKGLEPVAHTARFIEAQRAELTRLQQAFLSRLRNNGERMEVSQTGNKNDNNSNGMESISTVSATTTTAKHHSKWAPTMESSSSVNQPDMQAPSDEMTGAQQRTVRKPILSGRGGVTVTTLRTVPGACEDLPLLYSTTHSSLSHLQSSRGGMEAAGAQLGNEDHCVLSAVEKHIPLSNEVSVGEKPTSVEHVILYQHQPQEPPSPSTKDVSTADATGEFKNPAATEPEPFTAAPAFNLTPNLHVFDAVAVEMATRRVEALKRLCPFLPDMPCPGVFLEDLNLTDSRLEATVNRLRAVRGSASVMRDYRMLAQIEDSVCALVESLAAELCTTTLRMLSHYPFLDCRVNGVLLGNIPEIEMDDEFQSLLTMRRQAEKEQKPIASIDQCLRERAYALTSDIPYYVVYERYSAHPLVHSLSTEVPSAPLESFENILGGGNTSTERMNEAIVVAQAFPEETARRELHMHAVHKDTVFTHNESDSPITHQRQKQEQQPDVKCIDLMRVTAANNNSMLPRTGVPEAAVPSRGDRLAENTLACSLPLVMERISFDRTVVAQLTSQTASEDNDPSTRRLPTTSILSLEGKPSESKLQKQPPVSKLPTLSAVREPKENCERPTSLTEKASLFVCSVEGQEISSVPQATRLPSSVSGNMEAAIKFSAGKEQKSPQSLFFDTVHRALEDERVQMEQLESILKEIHQKVSAPQEGKQLQMTDTAERATGEKMMKEKPIENVQLSSKRTSVIGQHLKASPASAPVRKPTADAAESLRDLSLPSGVTAEESAPLGHFFEERHSGQTTSGLGGDNGAELLRKLIDGRRSVSETNRVKGREQVVRRLRQLKGDVRSSLPTGISSLTEAVVKSSWGTVRNDLETGQPQLLPSLSRGLSYGRGLWPPLSQEPRQREFQGHQRLPWGRHTVEPRSSLGVMVQRCLSSAPDTPRHVDKSLDLFPTIRLGASTDNLPHATQASEWEAISNITMGMRQQYAALCRQVGIKPNSALLRVLPDTHGVSVACIDTSANYIGPKGFAPLLQVLRGNVGLECLNLSHNNLENDEVIDLVNVLMTQSGASLRFLELSNNPISFAGGVALLRLVQSRPSLVSVGLKDTLIPHQLSQSIIEACGFNHGVLH